MKKRDYSSIILILLTVIFVSLCIVIVNFADNGTLFFRQTTTNTVSTTTVTTGKISDTPKEKTTIVINNSTNSSSSHDIAPYISESSTDGSTTPDEPDTTTTPPVTSEAPTTTEQPTTTEVPTTTEPTTTDQPVTSEPATTPDSPTTETSSMSDATQPTSADAYIYAPVIPENYDYSKPVPVSAPVDDNYFLDALFLGDSLTDGLALYSGLKTATFYSKQALSTATAFTTPVVTLGDEKLSIIDAMKVTSFNKVYIMLGINEVGYPSPNSFINKYEQIIDSVREVNPDATIYIQLILPITANRSETHKYIKNTAIDKFNTALIELAAQKQVFYLNVSEPLTDENGALLPEASTDGVHLKRDYYKVWLEYLKNHVIM